MRSGSFNSRPEACALAIALVSAAACAVGLEPVAVVVVLQLAQELDRLGRKATESGHRRIMPALSSDIVAIEGTA